MKDEFDFNDIIPILNSYIKKYEKCENHFIGFRKYGSFDFNETIILMENGYSNKDVFSIREMSVVAKREYNFTHCCMMDYNPETEKWDYYKEEENYFVHRRGLKNFLKFFNASITKEF